VTPFSLEPVTAHREVRAALHDLVGRFLADYERAARAHDLPLGQARLLGSRFASRSRSASSPRSSAVTRRTSA
jgi:hypothetical protein